MGDTSEQEFIRIHNRDARYRDRIEYDGLAAVQICEALERGRIPTVPNLASKIVEQIERRDGRLEMAEWHSCDTTHCVAGWAIHLAGAAGYLLEDQFGPARAGALIWWKSTGEIPAFYSYDRDGDEDEDALDDLRARAAEREVAP